MKVQTLKRKKDFPPLEWIAVDRKSTTLVPPNLIRVRHSGIPNTPWTEELLKEREVTKKNQYSPFSPFPLPQFLIFLP